MNHDQITQATKIQLAVTTTLLPRTATKLRTIPRWSESGSDEGRFSMEITDNIIVIDKTTGQCYETILFKPCKHTSNSFSSFAVANT